MYLARVLNSHSLAPLFHQKTRGNSEHSAPMVGCQTAGQVDEEGFPGASQSPRHSPDAHPTGETNSWGPS